MRLTPDQLARRRSWLERFPASELNARIDGIKQAKRDGWDREVWIVPGGREIIVLGVWCGFAIAPAGRLSAGKAA